MIHSNKTTPIRRKPFVLSVRPEPVEGSQNRPRNTSINSARTRRYQYARSGFSLLETIIAMTIIATMAVPLITMQGTVLRRMIRDARHEDRIFLMRNFLYEARQEAPPGATSFEKKIEKQNTELHYQLMPPKESSSLHDMKGIHIERITATWREMGKKVQEVMVTTQYIEPEAPKATK